MSKTNRSILRSLSFLGLLFASQSALAVPSVDHPAVLAPFVNDDTFAVVYADIGSFVLPEDKSELLNPIVLKAISQMPEPQRSEVMAMIMAEGFAIRFREAGGQSLYLLAGLGDVHLGGGPVLIARAKEGRTPEEIQKLLQQMVHEILDDKAQAALRPIAEQLDIQVKFGSVVCGLKSTVARYAALKPVSRKDLVEPLAKLTGEGAIVATVFCPGPDFRRVVRELWPTLPGSLASLSGDLADRWLYLEAAVNLLPNANPRIALQAKDDESAFTFVKLLRELPVALGDMKDLGDGRIALKQMIQTLVDLAPPTQEGSRVTMHITTDAKELSKIQEMLNRAVGTAYESADQVSKANKFKQIALAMFLYMDQHKTYPPAAIRDKDGKPLLSWRVAMLPYLDGGDLYNQFHLDEAWDSPHNRTLIAKIPDIFADPDASLKQLAGEGKTTFQVPTGPETVFYKNEGTAVREIPDGTAKTILLVDVDPQRAVEWTKPDDWQVDLSHPTQGLGQKDRKRFVAAWCDGSVRTIPADVDEAKLRACLTRKGGETVDLP
jgi:hypothetical protein